tara:strand:+ start:206 stop:628 length:423 start_codon:yes stop_codon:yes gene_type:complete
MKIIRVNKEDRQLIHRFLVNAGIDTLRSFTYFDSRSLDILDNHVVTLVLEDDDKSIIGYGHLDKEGETVWLGIALSQGHKGKGLGKVIMDALISSASEEGVDEIKLSVYRDNVPAQRLYEKFGFKLSDQNEKSYFYTLIL